MYNTLIMLKPDASFTIDELEILVRDVVRSGDATAKRQGNRISVRSGRNTLDIGWSDARHVLQESDEIADTFAVPSRGCHSRFEMSGDDPDMDLFNDYLIINERLQETGKFVIFDTQQGKLLFD